MKIYIPKISLEKLSGRQRTLYDQLSRQNYGKALADRVAQKLIAAASVHRCLYFSHRDYCGIGLFLEAGKFIMGTVYDGYGIQTPVIEFDSRLEFTEWLSRESDQSMSLYGQDFNNQTITKTRLDWFLEDDYSTSWNSYCRYLSKIS